MSDDNWTLVTNKKATRQQRKEKAQQKKAQRVQAKKERSKERRNQRDFKNSKHQSNAHALRDLGLVHNQASRPAPLPKKRPAREVQRPRASRRGRGRGRGPRASQAVRGRGGYRGRGNRRAGRGRGFGGRGGRRIEEEKVDVDNEKKESNGIEQYTPQLIRAKLFLKDAKIQDHLRAIHQLPNDYKTQLRILIEHKVALSFTVATKARILASLWIENHTDMVNYLLQMPTIIGLAEVLKCAQLLDAPRKVRQYKRKLSLLEARKEKDEKSVKQKTISEIRTHIHNLSTESHKSSLSGAKQKRLRKWITTIPKEQLEFFLLNYPTESWRQLADLIHAQKTNFQLDYFQSVCFGSPPPDDSFVAIAKSLNKDNLYQMLKLHPELANFYSFIRKICRNESEEQKQKEGDISDLMAMGLTRHQALLGLRDALPGYNREQRLQNIVEWIFENENIVSSTPQQVEKDWISDKTKALLAQKIPLETLIWWYHELQCPESESIFDERLKTSSQIFGAKNENDSSEIGSASKYEINYGKLMERLLWFRENGIRFANRLLPFAEEQIKTLHVQSSDNFRVAVLGDASGSMEVAIKSATIIGSLLSAALKADLVYFNTEVFAPPSIPRNARQVIQVVEAVKASGGTSMASALWPYYEKKQKIDMFVLVSDEGENSDHKGFDYARLFKKYREEIHPQSNTFLVSFLSVGDPGKIHSTLSSSAKYDAKQFRLDPRLPDTSKFDSLLGQISLEIQNLMK